MTEGTVDVAMLDERIAAERCDPATLSSRSSWSLSTSGCRHTLVRHGRARFDLDGVAKGWIADRALRLLDAYPGALVDADGDVAVRASRSARWHIAVGDPVDDAAELGRLSVPPGWPWDRFGVATSGTSVHRWSGPAGSAHHLIDPLTGRPALTDVVQATVVAESAAVAECLAKSAVIRGSRDGMGLLERAGAWAAVLLLEDGHLMTTPGESGWLA
jgi:thiamine biosynthesis lipoprotein